MVLLTASSDGAWGAWIPWASCSGGCTGANEYFRTRTCDDPAPLAGGNDCPTTDRNREEVELGE